MNNKKILLLSCALALLAVLFNYAYLHKREMAFSASDTLVKVIVASRDLPAGTLLENGMIEEAQVPKKHRQPGAMEIREMLLGKTLAIPALHSTQILESMLSYVDNAGLAAKIPKDMVAFTIAANDISAVAGLLTPGDSVDVLMSVEVGEIKEGELVNKQMVTKLVLEAVRIMAVNQQTRQITIPQQHDMVGSTTGNLFQNGQQTPLQQEQLASVTVAVSPAQCLKLSMAQEIGSLSLALRSSWAEGDLWHTKNLSSNDFLGVKKSVLRRSLPAWVEIRGADQFTRY